MKNYIILLVLVILTAGCSVDPYELLSRTADDPETTEPRVYSFETENQVRIAWDSDDAADSFVLYRDISSNGATEQVVYRGTDTQFIDQNVIDETKYYYRLSKVRGQREFPQSEFVLGVGSNVRQDIYENNDIIEKATFHENVTVANIYYYEGDSGFYLEDNDWYCVSINPRKLLSLTIDNFNNLSNGDIYFALIGSEPFTITAGAEIQISNYEYHEETYYFQITVNSVNFLDDPLYPGGKIGSYHINSIQTINIDPPG